MLDLHVVFVYPITCTYSFVVIIALYCIISSLTSLTLDKLLHRLGVPYLYLECQDKDKINIYKAILIIMKKKTKVR